MPEIKRYIDYYPFGALMPGRNTNTNLMRYTFSGKENDQEIKGDGNSIDFGARMHDPRLGRFLSIDAYQRDYAPVSPYSYSLNNPIIFKDEGGNWVAGLDGKPVTYTRNENGTITWSSNASADVQKVGNAMLTTPTGTEAFEFWQNSNRKVVIKYYKHKAEGAYAKTFHYEGLLGKIFKKVRVEFYEGSITDTDPEVENRFLPGDDPQRSETMEESIGAIGTHERWHLDAEQKKLDTQIPDEVNQPQNANKPINAEMKFKEEYRNAKGGKSFDPALYNERGFFGMDANYNVKSAPEALKRATVIIGAAVSGIKLE